MVSSDRRVQRTRNALREALIALLPETPYDDLTVQRILDRANVGRSTFYTHFADKDDLLLSGLDGLRVMLEEAQGSPGEVTEPAEHLIGFSRAMFEHAHDFRPVYHALVSSRVWPRVRQRLEEVLAGLVRRGCGGEIRRLRRAHPEMPVELFVHWVTSSFLTVLTWWIDEESTLSPEEIDRQFRALIVPSARL